MHNHIPSLDELMEIVAVEKMMIYIPLLSCLKAGDIPLSVVTEHVNDRLVEAHQGFVAPKDVEEVGAAASRRSMHKYRI